MKKREGYRYVIFEPAKTRIANNQCPSCSKPKSEWKRRKDWACCSTACTEEYHDKYTAWGWPGFREKVLKRDNYACVKCGDSRKEVEAIIKSQRIVNWDARMSGRDPKFIYEKFERKEMRTNFIADHIIPIAIGGEEWEMDNVQTLCQVCNKIKTKQDQKDIAKARQIEKKLVNQTQLNINI